MGRSSSLLLLPLCCLSSTSWAKDAHPAPIGADMILAQAFEGPGPNIGPGGAPYPIGAPGLQMPPPPFAFAPPPCIKPMIIQVGRGLEHAAKTKIVYGARPPCG